MKFILPKSSVQPIDANTVLVDVTPADLISKIQKLAGDPYTHLYVDWSKDFIDAPIHEQIRIYNNTIRDSGTYGTAEGALSAFQEKCGPQEYLKRAEACRREAAEFEAAAARLASLSIPAVLSC